MWEFKHLQQFSSQVFPWFFKWGTWHTFGFSAPRASQTLFLPVYQWFCIEASCLKIEMSLYFSLLCFHLPLIPLVLAPFLPQTHGFQDILGDLQGQLTEQLNQWLGGDACRLQLSNLVGRSTENPVAMGVSFGTRLLELVNILWIQVGILIGRQSKGVTMVSQTYAGQKSPCQWFKTWICLRTSWPWNILRCGMLAFGKLMFISWQYWV